MSLFHHVQELDQHKVPRFPKVLQVSFLERETIYYNMQEPDNFLIHSIWEI